MNSPSILPGASDFPAPATPESGTSPPGSDHRSISQIQVPGCAAAAARAHPLRQLMLRTQASHCQLHGVKPVEAHRNNPDPMHPSTHRSRK